MSCHCCHECVFHTVKHIQPVVRRELGQTWQRPEKQGMFGVTRAVKISVEKKIIKHLTM